jgi:hypothetical protein
VGGQLPQSLKKICKGHPRRRKNRNLEIGGAVFEVAEVRTLLQKNKTLKIPSLDAQGDLVSNKEVVTTGLKEEPTGKHPMIKMGLVNGQTGGDLQKHPKIKMELINGQSGGDLQKETAQKEGDPEKGVVDLVKSQV